MSLILFNGCDPHTKKSVTSLQMILNNAADGYKVGLSWNLPYTPMGPHIYKGRNEELRRLALLINNAWRAGFKEGFACQQKKL